MICDWEISVAQVIYGLGAGELKKYKRRRLQPKISKPEGHNHKRNKASEP